MNERMTEKRVYRDRREMLAKILAETYGGGVALIPSAPEAIRNHTTTYPYRSESNLYYLTGFPEPESVLALIVNAKGKARHILFCRDKNPDREVWEGERIGVKAAREPFLFDQTYPIEKLNTMMFNLIVNTPVLLTPIGLYREWDDRIIERLSAVRALARSGHHPPATLIDARDVIAPMRMVKDAHEIALLKKAARISAAGHIRAMQSPCVGRYEYEIEAELTHTFLSRGARAHAYPPIVASGKNACVLHYTDNQSTMKRGELLLIDAGCEYQNYAGDITRTFPVGKRFTSPQRDIYRIVLDAQRAALDALKVGAPFGAYHDAAARVLSQGLIDLKLIKGSLNAVMETKKYRRFYMHGTGHWLGLDVHDAGFYKNNHKDVTLMPGMVLTVEPGLYIRAEDNVPAPFHNIGVRIEDDVLITESGIEVITDEVPKTIQAIEALRAGI